MRLVVLESPFGSPLPDVVEANVTYARRAMKHCFSRGEAPYASHMLYPGTLDDNDPEERMLGITAGLEWGDRATVVAVYADRGISKGMRLGLQHHAKLGKRVEVRFLDSVSIFAAQDVRAEVEGIVGYRVH